MQIAEMINHEKMQINYNRQEDMKKAQEVFKQIKQKKAIDNLDLNELLFYEKLHEIMKNPISTSTTKDKE